MIHRSGGGEIKSTLTFPAAEQQDQGQYLCVAENKVFKIEKHFVFDHYAENDFNNWINNLRLVELKPTSH